MQGVEMQYSPAYVQDVSRQAAVAQPPPQPQYGSYPQSSILSSTPQQAMYESIPQYQQRQTAAIEVMSSQMGALPQYMQPGPSQYAASQPEPVQYAAAAHQSTIPSQYGSQQVEYAIMEQPTSQQPGQPSVADQEAYQQELRELEMQLRATFEAILAIRLNEASDKILNISRWLANAVLPLGKRSHFMAPGI